MRTPLFLVWLLVLAPVADAAPVTRGTESDPELVDASDNVAYHPAYLGPHDRAHVDILAAWYEYIPANDTLMFSWKFADLRDLAARANGWQLTYTFAADIRGGDNQTSLHHDVWKDEASTEIQHRSSVSRPGLVSGDIKARFVVEETQPGYIRVYSALTKLTQWGTSLANFNATAGELDFLTPVNAISNSNQASSSKTFDFSSLRPSSTWGPDGPDFSSTRSPSGDPGGSSETGMIGLLGVMAALVASAVILRRR